MSQFSQEKRKLSLTTPLGDDVLLLTRFSGQEELSRLFNYRLEMFSPEDDLNPAAIVGKAVTWTVSGTGETPRYFNGVVHRFSAGPHLARGVRIYRADVVPWLWFLTRTTNCRIFQHKSVPEIVKAMFDGLGFTHYHFSLKGDYPRRDYCVQYRETAFNFVSRLLEQEGIFYFFRHEAGKHTLVLADHIGAYRAGPASEVEAWEHTYSFCSGKWTHTDYDFEKPSTNLLTHSQTGIPLQHAHKFEFFDYPGNYVTRRPVGEGYAKVRMEAEELDYEGASGTGQNDTFSPGLKFTLARHDVASEKGKEYVVTAVQHFGQDPSHLDANKVATYHNEFSCIPARVIYRPVQQTPKPFVQGPQTAVVVGPKGEEIYCDKYGRIKVQFHWDREGKKNENSSCWIRVAQSWAGGNFGAIAIPRIGHEVVVDFLEGDPDQPMILGSVYNAGQMPPFSLPENRMFSGIKSKSVKGHPGKNFSGLQFNDTAGSERVGFYAEKDMLVNSEHNLNHHVGNYQSSKVGKIHLSSVGGLPGSGGGGGGSGGGGGGGYTGKTPEGDTVDKGLITAPGPPPPPPPPPPSVADWKTSDGQTGAQLGLAGSTVYGINNQDTMGFMHQVTIGVAYTFFIDPFSPAYGFLPNALGAAAGGPLLGLLGAFGGNVQITWGTNIQASYGASVTITHGTTVTINGAPSIGTTSMAVAVPLLCLAYQIAYAEIGHSGPDAPADAAACAEAFGACAIAVNALLLTLEGSDKEQEMAKQFLAAKTEDGLLTASLAIAKSKLASDFAQLQAPLTKLSADAIKPDLPKTLFDPSNTVNFVDGTSLVIAKHVHLIARKVPPTPPELPDPIPSTIYIKASGMAGDDDGLIFMNATKGMNFTSGKASMELVKEGFIDLVAGPVGAISLRGGGKGDVYITAGIVGEGPWPPPNPPPLPGSIITLTAEEGMTLSCGKNSIKIDSTGVTIDALNITLKAKVLFEIETLQKTFKATLSKHDLTMHQIT